MSIKIENVDVFGWEASIRGLRSPLNSWDKSDSGYVTEYDEGGFGAEFYKIGNNDLDLMEKLAVAGSDHRKFMRMINVTMDITAPLYWWKEFDTYKVGTVCNSCSTMHTITKRPLQIYDFSCESLGNKDEMPFKIFEQVLKSINFSIELFQRTGIREYWYQVIQMLPESFNQRRTIQLNYEVLHNIYFARKSHKLDEWRMFCKWIEQLQLSKLIIGGIEK